MTTGWKSSILGYMSIGEMVPLVMTTEENFSKTGAIARAGSMQLCGAERGSGQQAAFSVGRTQVGGAGRT
jgi:hypothetical protein